MQGNPPFSLIGLPMQTPGALTTMGMAYAALQQFCLNPTVATQAAMLGALQAHLTEIEKGNPVPKQ